MTGHELAIAACNTVEVLGIAGFLFGVGILMSGRWSRS